MNPVQIIESAPDRMAVIDLESKLLQNNMIFITSVITAESVATYQAELIYLISKIPEDNKEQYPISIYINSPGGCVYSCFGLYDVMQSYIKQGYIIKTINIGLAASAAAIILLSGSKGYRYCMPNATVLVHQPSSGMDGTVTDMKIEVEECDRAKKVLNDIVSKHASEELSEFMERDKWLSAEAALKYNIIDSIL